MAIEIGRWCVVGRGERRRAEYFVGGKVEPRISRWVPEARKRPPYFSPTAISHFTFSFHVFTTRQPPDHQPHFSSTWPPSGPRDSRQPHFLKSDAIPHISPNSIRLQHNITSLSTCISIRSNSSSWMTTNQIDSSSSTIVGIDND